MKIFETVTDTLSNALNCVQEYFNEETTLPRKTIAITCAVFALIGIVYGFLISPVKKGIQVNVTNNNCDFEED